MSMWRRARPQPKSAGRPVSEAQEGGDASEEASPPEEPPPEGESEGTL